MQISRLLHWIESISKYTGVCSCFFIVILIGVVLYEVAMRYVFNVSQVWAYEMSVFLFGSLFVLGGAYALLHQAHVRMDIIYSKLPDKKRAIMDIVTFVFFLIFIGCLIWKGWTAGLKAFQVVEKTNSVWEPVVWPIKMVIPFGAFLVLLQGIANLIRSILILRDEANGN